MLVVEHALFGATTAFAFLPADFLDAGTLGIHVTFFEGFDLVEQKAAREVAIESLGAGGLAFDLEPCRTVEQHYAGGGLVDVLPAVSTGTDEHFFNVGFAHAECRHALHKLGFLLRADRIRAHNPSVTGSGQKDNGEVDVNMPPP